MIQFQERFRLGSTRKLNQIKILHVLTFYSDLRSFYLFASDKISCECCSPELGYCKLFTFDQRMRIIEGGTQQLGVDTGYFTLSFIHFVNTILHTVSSTKCALFKKSPNVLGVPFRAGVNNKWQVFSTSENFCIAFDYFRLQKTFN